MSLGIGGKLRMGFGLVVALTAVCGVTGLLGIGTLTRSLDYLTGPAWDTADGAMEGAVEVEAQMLAAQAVRDGVDAEANQKRIAEAKARATDALERMRTAGLLPPERLVALADKQAAYDEKLGALLSSHALLVQARDDFRQHTDRFVELGEALEEIGDGAVEDIEAQPDRKISWNDGLRWRWEAADGGMESNIGMLWQLYHIARLESGADLEDVKRAVVDAERFQLEASQGMLATDLFDAPAAQFGHPELSLEALYRHWFAFFREKRDLYVERFAAFDAIEAQYQAVASAFLVDLNAVAELADGAVEDQVTAIDASASRAKTIMTGALAAGILVGLAAGFLLARGISGSIRDVVERLRQVAEGDGDLTQRMPVTGSDEIGALSAAFNLFAEKVHATVREVVSVTGDMTSGSHSANRLAEVAGGMVADIRNFAGQSEEASHATEAISQSIATVASAVEESSSNVRGVASAVEQVSGNLSSVASNAESMAASVGQVAGSVEAMRGSLANIAKSSTQAAQVAERAAGSARRSDEMVGALGQSAKQIGKFVEVINDISEQTNLLALNATIEAAAAGDAGRGFAVVANEVKDLAKQTAEATDEIRRQVEAMQSNTDAAVGSIDEIRNVIDEINGISRTIAELVEGQLSSTQEIVGAVGNASEAAQIINRNIREASAGSTEVARNAEELVVGVNEIASSAGTARNGAAELAGRVQEVSRVAGQMEGSAAEVDRAAAALAGLAEKLGTAVGSFTV